MPLNIEHIMNIDNEDGKHCNTEMSHVTAIYTGTALELLGMEIFLRGVR